MGKNKNNDELLRSQINDIIEGEIQNGINDYLEEKEKKRSSGVGFSDPEEQATGLNVKVSQNEIDKILKEYKRIKKAEKSNLGEVKKLNLTDQFGRQL
tara:strand:+ start:1137 stop:1430 length:294 start_codon:yes stop_codon:yes gene_type:complete